MTADLFFLALLVLGLIWMYFDQRKEREHAPGYIEKMAGKPACSRCGEPEGLILLSDVLVCQDCYRAAARMRR